MRNPLRSSGHAHPGAIVSAVLVIHFKDGTSAVDQLALSDQDLRDANGGTPPGSGMVIILLREVASPVGAEACALFAHIIFVSCRKRQAGRFLPGVLYLRLDERDLETAASDEYEHQSGVDLARNRISRRRDRQVADKRYLTLGW